MTEPPRSLSDFSVRRWLGVGAARTRSEEEALNTLRRSLKESLAGEPRLVVVHDAYPPQPGTDGGGREEIPELRHVGLGKTGLLEIFVGEAGRDPRCQVLAFLDTRQKLKDRGNFLRDFLAPTLFSQPQAQTGSPARLYLESALLRLWLAAHLAPLQSVALLIWLGSASVAAAARSVLQAETGSSLALSGWLWGVGLLLLLSWSAGVLRELRHDPQAKGAYNMLAPSQLLRERRRPERLLESPTALPALLPTKQCLVLVVDDVEHVDEQAFALLLRLFEVAKAGGGKQAALLAFGFNPRSPLQQQPRRELLQRRLSPEAIAEQSSWRSACVRSLDLEHFRELQTLVTSHALRRDASRFLWALTTVCQVLVAHPWVRQSLKAPQVADYAEWLNTTAVTYMERFRGMPASVDPWDRATLALAASALAKIHCEWNRDPEVGLVWLENRFDLLASLELFGRTVLVGGALHDTLQTHRDGRRRRLYEKRIIEAAQRLNPDEKVDWASVGRVLRLHFSINDFGDPKGAGKREQLGLGRARLAEGELAAGVATLTQGAGLIDWENPEEIDFEILAALEAALEEVGQAGLAEEISQGHQQLAEVAQSRVFLLLAQRFHERGWDARHLLEIATRGSFTDNRYYRQARQMLEELEQAQQACA